MGNIELRLVAVHEDPGRAPSALRLLPTAFVRSAFPRCACARCGRDVARPLPFQVHEGVVGLQRPWIPFGSVA